MSVKPHKRLWLEATGEQHERVILYKEDRIAIENAGYDISSWSTPEPKVPVPIEVVIVEKQGTRRVLQVHDVSEKNVWIDVNRKHKL